jgi:His-Xaa-Ser system protein HxsD
MDASWANAEVVNGALALTVDERIYSVDVVLRTSYWFTDRAYVFISKLNDHELQVHLKAKPRTLESPQSVPLADLAGEFSNALLDHEIRDRIEVRTGRIRELLVTKALAEAGVLEEPVPGTPNDPVAAQGSADLTRITP